MAGASAITPAGSRRPARLAPVSAFRSASPSRTARNRRSPRRRSHNRQSGTVAVCNTVAASGKSRCSLRSSAASRASNCSRARASARATAPVPAAGCDATRGGRPPPRPGRSPGSAARKPAIGCCARGLRSRRRARQGAAPPATHSRPAAQDRFGGELDRSVVTGSAIAAGDAPAAGPWHRPSPPAGGSVAATRRSSELPSRSSGIPSIGHGTAVIREPLSQVPLVESRSRTETPSRPTRSSACRRETSGSASSRSACALRPIRCGRAAARSACRCPGPRPPAAECGHGRRGPCWCRAHGDHASRTQSWVAQHGLGQQPAFAEQRAGCRVAEHGTEQWCQLAHRGAASAVTSTSRSLRRDRSVSFTRMAESVVDFRPPLPARRSLCG